jgi:hypothetical protein
LRFALSLLRSFLRVIENKASCLIELDHRTDRLFTWIRILLHDNQLLVLEYLHPLLIFNFLQSRLASLEC